MSCQSGFQKQCYHQYHSFLLSHIQHTNILKLVLLLKHVFLDISKAFDSLCHESLLFKYLMV